MNKPIIVDGVDVSECDYVLNNSLKGKQHCPNKAMPYAKETSCIECKTNSTRYNFCKHNPNCYFKQLQRLKAENEELKEENDTLRITIEKLKGNLYIAEDSLRDYQELYDKLEKKKEKLKTDKKYRLEEIQNLNNKIKILTSITDKTNKFKQALEEIQNVLFPKNKLLITDSKGLLKTQEILKEVLENV